LNIQSDAMNEVRRGREKRRRRRRRRKVESQRTQ
jgi:hypothetical protein